MLRTVLPHKRQTDDVNALVIGHSKDLPDRVTGQEVNLELLESEL